jgi:hypothetical protein
MRSLNDNTTALPFPTALSSSSRRSEFQCPPKQCIGVGFSDGNRSPLSTVVTAGDGGGQNQKRVRELHLQLQEEEGPVEGRSYPDPAPSVNGISTPPSIPASLGVASTLLHHRRINDAMKWSDGDGDGECGTGGGGSGGFGMTRSHTLQSLSASSTSSSKDSSFGLLQDNITLASSASPYSSLRGGAEECLFPTFGMDVRRYTRDSSEVPVIDKGMRQILEPHMRKARLMRERARNRTHLNVHDSISSSMGVPYFQLRSERPFLYDTYTHPIHEVLAETLGVEDLSKIHKLGDGNVDLDQLFGAIKSRKGRRNFHEAYDNFVTSFCIPLLHSMALAKNLLHGTHNGTRMSNSPHNSLVSNALDDGASSQIAYRYQAFPSIRVVRPGDASEGPQCDTATGHSIGFLRFHVPLTATFGTNALYTESHPGKEDWHPLQTKSVGLGFLFDGGRCINFNLENTTDSTMVALDFCIAIYYSDTITSDICGTSEAEYLDGDSLCTRWALEDQFSLAGPGFYDEAVIDVRPGGIHRQVAAKKRCLGKKGSHSRLLDPDERVGFPFS